MKAAIKIGHLNHGGNDSSLLRTAEVFGINHAYVYGEKRGSYDISQGADQHFTFFEFDSNRDLLTTAKARNHSVVAIENTPNAEMVGSEIEYPCNPLFVVGNEGQGVSKETIDAADLVVKIPQAPTSYVRCLNTTISGAIVLHDWYQSRLAYDKQQYYE